TWGELKEQADIPRAQGQLTDTLEVFDAGDLYALGADDRRGTGHLDDSLNVAQREHGVHNHRLTCGELQGPLPFLEAFLLHRQPVGPARKGAQIINPDFIRL